MNLSKENTNNTISLIIQPNQCAYNIFTDFQRLLSLTPDNFREIQEP